MASYFVTGVWKDANKVITEIFLHSVNSNGSFGKGQKTTVADGVRLIESGSSLKTMRWDYKIPGWVVCEPILVIHQNGKFLRTKADAKVEDNLDNMISMTSIA